MKTLLVRLTGAVGAITLLASSALPVAAMTPRGGETYLLPQQEIVNDDLYAGGSTLILNGTVNGDALAGGGTIVLNGTVKQDFVAVGGNITVAGDVGDDLRMAGGNLTILKNVKGDVVMGGGNVLIGKDAVINGDLVVGAGSLVIEGTVKGNVLIGGGQVVLNGKVGGFIQVNAEDLRLGANARLAKGLKYTSPKTATLDEGSQVVGGVAYVKAEERKGLPRLNRDARPENILGALFGFAAFVFLTKMFALMIAGVVFTQCFKTYSAKLVDHVLSKPGKALGMGAITLFMVPIATFVLAITILGLPIASVLGSGYGFIMMLSTVYSGVVFGAWLWRLGSKGKARHTDWKAAVVGVFLLSFICLIPIIGWIIGALVFIGTLGGLYMMTEERLKAMR